MSPATQTLPDIVTLVNARRFGYNSARSLQVPTSARSPSPAWYVYLLRCADGTLYTGCTTDLAAREHKHNEGRGAKYTAGRRPVRLVYSEVHESRSAALAREAEVKRWTRARKEDLLLRPSGFNGTRIAEG